MEPVRVEEIGRLQDGFPPPTTKVVAIEKGRHGNVNQLAEVRSAHRLHVTVPGLQLRIFDVALHSLLVVRLRLSLESASGRTNRTKLPQAHRWSFSGEYSH